MWVGVAANAPAWKRESDKLTARSTYTINSLALALMLGLLSSGLAGPQTQASNRIVTHYEASEEDFPNPERGFHKNTDLLTARDLHWVREQGYSLVRTYVQLDDFRDRPLSPAFLQKLNAGFAAARAGGVKVLPVFSYNFPTDEDIKAGHLKDIPDAPLPVVLQHLRQLKPVLAENQDVIAALELGFVGAWGEWHSSKNGLDSPENKRIIQKAILEALPSSRMMQLRYPGDLLTLFPAPLTAKQAHNRSAQARTGWANMCFLSNEHDAGTYLPLERKAEMQAYLEKTTPYVIVGGETCQVTPGQTRGDCETAQAEMARFHFSYLNRDFYAPALERWKQVGCLNTISRRLGYRLRLTTSDIPRMAHSGETVNLRFALVNDGYAAPYNPRRVEVILRSKTNGQSYRFPVSADLRQWQPGNAEYVVNARISLPAETAAGEYDVLLHLPDPMPSLANRPEYAIRFANQNTWEPTTGFNRLLTSLTISR